MAKKCITFQDNAGANLGFSSEDVLIKNLIINGRDFNGISLNEALQRLFSTTNLTFYHISDTHGYQYGINKCIELMGDDPSMFTVLTGDIVATAAMKTAMVNSGKFYTLLGNHDYADKYGYSSLTGRQDIIDPVCGTRVNFGSANAAYWYADIQAANGYTVRMISFDEYEGQVVGQASWKYQVIMSQAQIDWFINLLKNTPSTYGLILLHHQPVSAARVEHTDLFVSESAPLFYEYEGTHSDTIPQTNMCPAILIPMIMDAYLNKGTFAGTFFCGSSNGTTMTFNEDFSNVTPCKFLAHIGGHTHWDCVEYLPLFPAQLQILIDQDRSQRYTYSDLPRVNSASDPSSYCINKYTINLDSGAILIERIGAMNTLNGQVRNEIEFVN